MAPPEKEGSALGGEEKLNILRHALGKSDPSCSLPLSSVEDGEARGRSTRKSGKHAASRSMSDNRSSDRSQPELERKKVRSGQRSASREHGGVKVSTSPNFELSNFQRFNFPTFQLTRGRRYYQSPRLLARMLDQG